MMRKMWQRLLGSLLAIILIVPFCFTTALAANGSNYIGEDTVNNVNVVVSYNTEKVSVAWYSTQLWKHTLTINYNCVANTNTRIYYATIGNNAHFLSYNCTIENVASNYIEIKTVNQEYAELEIYDTSTITFSGVIGLQSATKIADGTNSQLKTITDTYLSSMKTSLSALRTQVDSIAGYVDGLEGYVDGIEGKLDLAYTRLGEINTAMSVVEDLVNNVDATLGNISLEMEYFETQLRNIKTNLDTQINQLNTMTLVLGDIIDAITTLNTTVTGIDSLIDTISWSTFTSSSYGFNTDGSTSVSTEDITSNTRDIYLNILVPIEVGTFIYKIETGIFTNSYTANDNKVPKIEIKTLGSNARTLENYYVDNTGRYLTIYIYDYLGSNNTTRYLQIHASNDGSSSVFLRAYGTRLGFSKISSNDIEYWQLLNYFKDYKYHTNQIASNELIADKLDDILEAIGNVSITTEQIDNSTTTFDNSVNQFQTVENIYNQQFNEVKNNVNNFDFSVSNGLSSGALKVSDLFSSFYNIEFFRVPILIVLACAIFLIVLG